MTRYKLTIQYDGTKFSGFQVQPDRRTIQGEIEKALTRMTKGDTIRIIGSGRTDAGVHALGQVIHFDFYKTLPDGAMVRALNSMLSDDIVIIEEEIVSENFHARYDALDKTYAYKIYNGKFRNPFNRNYTLWHPYDLSLDAMQQAIKLLIGEHDFTGFASTKNESISKVRTIYDAACTYNVKDQSYTFTFTGNGFLYNQVRVMVGTLLEIGDGRRQLRDINVILQAKDRTIAGQTAASQGLYLMKVNY